MKPPSRWVFRIRSLLLLVLQTEAEATSHLGTCRVYLPLRTSCSQWFDKVSGYLEFTNSKNRLRMTSANSARRAAAKRPRTSTLSNATGATETTHVRGIPTSFQSDWRSDLLPIASHNTRVTLARLLMPNLSAKFSETSFNKFQRLPHGEWRNSPIHTQYQI